MKFSGKNVLVTGAASGIGKQISTYFSAVWFKSMDKLSLTP